MNHEKLWYQYSEPAQIDGQWTVTVTNALDPEDERVETFSSEEEAQTYIKKHVAEQIKKIHAESENNPSKRQGKYKDANYEILELTEEQKQFVQENWTKMDLKTLTQKTFNNPEINGHHTEAKSIKAYISSLSPNGEETPAIKTTQRVTKGSFELTPAQKATIDSLLNTDQPPSTKEIFKLLFPKITLKHYLIPEYKAVAKYIREVNEEAVDIWDEPVENRRYKPPKIYPAVIGLVNRYVSNPFDPSKAMYDPANIKPAHEKNLKALMSYMQMTRFVLQASQYDKKADRDLFESTFVRQVQDKAADLTPEEVDMYIAVAQETVSVAQIERSITRQERLIDETLEEKDDKEGSKARLSMSLVESVNSLREKLDKSKGRLKGLIESVAGSRKDRLDGKANQNDSIANLIGAWMDEKRRQEMIAIAKKEHAEDAAEMERLESLDDTFALIAGMSKQEAILGPQ